MNKTSITLQKLLLSYFHSLLHFNSWHISPNFKLFFIELSIGSTSSPWLTVHLSTKTHESDFILDQNIFLGDLTWKIQLVHSCIKFENPWSKLQFNPRNSLFGLYDKHVSFGIQPYQILIKLGDHVKNISRFTFYISNCFKLFQFSNYPLVTLDLTQTQTDDEESKVVIMSSRHPNSNM